jgi:hypothetical protein
MDRRGHGVVSAVLFVLAVGVGLFAILTAAPDIALVYLALCAVLFVVVLWGFCARCPHRGVNCAHLIPGVLASLLPERTCQPYSSWETAGVAVALLFMVLFPQPWLIATPPLLVLFWALVAGAALEIRVAVCRGCANIYCPSCPR